MKSLIYNLLAAGIALISFSSCQKDEAKLILQPNSTLTLTPSTTTPTLSSDKATSEAVTFNWTPAQYGFSAPVIYSLQFGKKGNNFSDSINVAVDNKTTLTMTVADLNQLLLKLGLPAGSAGQVDVRVKSELTRPLGQPGNQLYSAATTLTGTPYSIAPIYPAVLYVPGAYQGWKPDVAPSLILVKEDGTYEGYVNFQEASEFKLTTAPSWDKTNYGTGGVGKISATGDNLKIDSPSYYLLKASLSALTWSATKTAWGIIGAATPKGWDASTPMTYDAATGTWQVTLDLKADEFKFRANDVWDINFGDTKADGILDYDGDNIKVATAGKYLVKLDLSKSGKYTYTLTKQ